MPFLTIRTTWLAPASLALALLLQGCATVSPTGASGIRALPQARIELDAPRFEAAPVVSGTPDLIGFLSRGSRAMGKVLQSALSYTGTRYRYGGSSPVTGFDCSGFVGHVFRESAGLKLPRASYQMATMDGRKLSRKELEAGDLVFFAHRKRISHVGIYLGDGRFIHAPSTGGRVRTDRMSDRYWSKRFVNGKRVLDPAHLAESTQMAGDASPIQASGGAESRIGLFGSAGVGAP